MEKKCNPDIHLDSQSLTELLDRRFDMLDWESTRKDMSEFVSDDSAIESWEPEKYKELARRIGLENE